VPFVAFALALALQQAPTAPPAPIDASPQDPKELFSKAKCTLCHGEDGRGRTPKGKKLKAADLTSPKWDKETTDEEIVETIQDGIKEKKGKVRMPAFKSKLNQEQIRALAEYVRTFARK